MANDIVKAIAKNCKIDNIYDVVIYDRNGVYIKTKRFNSLQIYKNYLNHIVKEEQCSLSSEHHFSNGNILTVALQGVNKED